MVYKLQMSHKPPIYACSQIGSLPRTYIPAERPPWWPHVVDLLFSIYEIDLNLARHSTAYLDVHAELGGVLNLLCGNFKIPSWRDRTIRFLNAPLTLSQQNVMVGEIMHRVAALHTMLQRNFTFQEGRSYYGYVIGTQLFDAVNTLLHHLNGVKERLIYAAEASSTPSDTYETVRHASTPSHPSSPSPPVKSGGLLNFMTGGFSERSSATPKKTPAGL